MAFLMEALAMLGDGGRKKEAGKQKKRHPEQGQPLFGRPEA